MNRYQCHKIIHATPMTRGEYNTYRGWTIPKDENPADDGYLVIYNKDTPEHYESWTPKKQLDEGYSLVSGDGFSFGIAVSHLKAGKAVTRKGWNGKGMFLYYVSADSYPAKTDIAKNAIGDMVPYRDYIAMKTVNNEVVPWVASQSDILVDDWEIAQPS